MTADLNENGVDVKPLSNSDKEWTGRTKPGWRNSRAMNFVRQNLLLILTIVGILLGFLVGLVIRPFRPSPDALMWLGFPGELFMRLLKMMILPLIICSVISGTASLNPKANGKISVIAFTYCLTTNFIACLIGLVFSLAIRPARYMVGNDSATVKTQMLQTQDIFADLLRNLVPDNIVEACFRQDQTQYIKERVSETLSNLNATHVNVTETELFTLTKTLGKVDGANILGLVVACVLIGISVNRSGHKGKPFLVFFTSATEIVLNLLRWLLWYTPVGVFSLIAVSLGSIDNIEREFAQLGLFLVTVSVGVATHQVVLMPLVIFFLARKNPIRFFLSLSRAWMIGFATTATAMAIPEMLQASEGPHKVDKRISRFVIPFCVTMNADGSAIYITSATLFVAAATGNSLEASSVVITLVLVSIAALAIPSVPSASIVTLIVILTSLNIPANQIAFLFTVEWFLDRIRTTSNVVSHTTCAAVVFRFCNADLEMLPEEEDEVEMEVLIDSSASPSNIGVVVK